MGPRKKKSIPLEVYTDTGSVECNPLKVLSHWQNEFDKLLNTPVVKNRDENLQRYITEYITMKEASMMDPLYVQNQILNNNITREEVVQVLKNLKNGKAVGYDAIPNEILKCEDIVPVLVQLFQFSFDTGIIPGDWYNTIVQPIPKSNESDPRVPGKL